MEEEIKKEIIGKAGFPLYVDYWDKYFSLMSGEQVKEVLEIVYYFNKTFEVNQSKDLSVVMVVNTIVDNIKRDASKRLKQSRASRDNGKMGGRPPKDEGLKTKRTLKRTGKRIESNTDTETETNYIPLSEGLFFILEEKLNKSLPKSKITSWSSDIRKLIEIDLKNRVNPFDDVKSAIQVVADNYGKDYFPIIQSGDSLRVKFDKIESYQKRTQPKQSTANKRLDFFNNIANKLGDINEQ